MTGQLVPGPPDVADAVNGLYRDGIVRKPQIFSRHSIRKLAEDGALAFAFADARSRKEGAVECGPNRGYVVLQPEALRGFVDPVDQSWGRAVAEAVLGPDYPLVQIGFDMPLAAP